MKLLLNVVMICASIFSLAGCARDSQSIRPQRSPVAVDPEDFQIGLYVGEIAEIIFQQGYVYTDGKIQADSMEELQRLFINHGATEMMARINTKRTKGEGNVNRSLKSGLARARIAAKLGLYFNPELGLFGEYADARGQMAPDFSEYPEIKLPGPWETLTIEQMEGPIQQYTQIAAREIVDTGAEVDFWKIGNEVNFGIAGVALPSTPGILFDGRDDWYVAPDNIDPEIGRMPKPKLFQMPEEEWIAWCRKHLWPYEARIIAAAERGIREVEPDAKFSIHIAFWPFPSPTCSPPAFELAFFKAMQEGGVQIDQIALSFYPNEPGHDRITPFKKTVKALTDTFQMPVYVMETSAIAEPFQTEAMFSDWTKTYPNYPMSEKGQADFLRDLTSWGLANGISGVRPYGADMIFDFWEPMALFKLEEGSQVAVASKGLDAIREGLGQKVPAKFEEGNAP